MQEDINTTMDSKSDVNENVNVKLDSSSNSYKTITMSDLSNNLLSANQFNILKFICYKTNWNMEKIVEKMNTYNGNYKKLLKEFEENKLINIVMRQTTYDKNEAYDKLKMYKGDVNAVVREYLGGGSKKNEDNKTVNQQMFKEMRYFMDGVKRDYDNRKKAQENMKLINTLLNKGECPEEK